MDKKKLTKRVLAEFEAGRDVWQEVLDGVREIKAGGGKPKTVEPRVAHGMSSRLASTRRL